MYLRLWQRCSSLLRIMPSSDKSTAWSRVDPLLPRRLCSHLSLPLSVNRASLRQRGSGLCVSSWLQPRRQPEILEQKAKYCSSVDDSLKGESQHGVSSGYKRNNVTPQLPRLPVPKVKDTMDKYLTVLSTVLDPYPLHVTTGHVTEFMTPGGWADTLQDYLLKRRDETENWASDWWLDEMYLKNRLPLPINFNPGIQLPTQHFKSKEEYLRFVSRFVTGILMYVKMMDSGTLPVVMLNRTEPLCMEQAYRVFSSHRRPAIPKDRLLTGLGKQTPRFFVVACRNQFYRVDVEQDGVPLSEEELFCQLCKVRTAAQHHCAGSPPVGILTSTDRSSWARAWENLAAGENKNNLEIIENAMLVISLDIARKPSSSSSSSSSSPSSASSSRSSTAKEEEEEDEEEERINLAHYTCHGQGSAFSSANRWFDSSFQIFVAEDGSFGGMCEHSVAEGEPYIAALTCALDYCFSHGPCEGRAEQQSRSLKEPVWLKWTTSPKIEQHIALAKEHTDRNVENVDMCGRHFKEFGREFPKGQGISPDTFLQLAIQMAYYRLYGRLTMSYESATLRRFKHGREDNIRVNSPPVLWWIQAMCEETRASEPEKMTLFKAAMEWKETYTRDLAVALDCHLIGLREAARELNVLDSIPLFSDPSFQRAFQFTLTTSQIPNRASLLQFLRACHAGWLRGWLQTTSALHEILRHFLPRLRTDRFRQVRGLSGVLPCADARLLLAEQRINHVCLVVVALPRITH